MKIKRYSENIKRKARQLRRRDGLSYKEISDKLDIAKSTAKFWCQGVELSAKHRKRLYTKRIKALIQGPNSSHERRMREVEKIVKESEKEIELPINFEALRLTGAALYWAEGEKAKHFSIANSDPHLIKFAVNWMKETLDIYPERIKAHLNIYPQQNEKKLKQFWSEVTGIPLTNFGKSFIKPKNKNYRKNTLYFGTIKIRVARGTDFKHRVFGWINAILKDTKSEIDRIERKWHKLKTDYPRP